MASGKRQQAGRTICAICGRSFARSALLPFEAIRASISDLIARDNAEWGEGSLICARDHAHYRRLYIERMLEEERGELSALDRRVVESVGTDGIISQPSHLVMTERMTAGERAADAVAAFGGSWGFILSFIVVLMVWMAVNVTGFLVRPFDPYPFILLNLVLSCVAALQAPVIMMSQKRQEQKDRLRAENDYQVNLKAELEIRQLREMMEHQIARQWDRLTELQQIQIDLLEERARKS